MAFDDPLSMAVAAEVSWLIDHLVRTQPETFRRVCFADLDGRVWIDRTPSESGSTIFWHLLCDPLDGGDIEKLLSLTFEQHEGMRVQCDDAENLFWWAMWLSNYRSSKTSKDSDSSRSNGYNR